MPRLTGISDRDAGLAAKIVFFFTRRKFKQMTGRETATMLEPLRMYAHIPRVLRAIGGLEQGEAKLDVLSPRQRALAELKWREFAARSEARAFDPSTVEASDNDRDYADLSPEERLDLCQRIGFFRGIVVDPSQDKIIQPAFKDVLNWCDEPGED